MMNNADSTFEIPDPGYHTPVLYNECLDALNIKPDGIYVDCTFGGGGHSRGILNKLNQNGRLIAFDQDADAQNNLPEDERLIFVPENFRHLQRFLRLYKFKEVDGVLADLGVSSHQFDEGKRGFSIRFSGPLDMRMDRRQHLTAADILHTYSAEQLHKLFEKYGEVTNAKTIARHIVQYRNQASLKTIEEFRALLNPVIKGNPNKYLAKVFQALRIEVNDEITALKEMLQQARDLLRSGGRIAVVTFHSIEDRLVKNFFRSGVFETPEHQSLGQQEIKNELRIITKKPLTSSREEMIKNPRAGSAKLRVAEKI